MCGICGFITNGRALSEETLLRMNTAIRRRGPDGSGHLYTGKVGLAMRRLAIIDLAGGQQPIYNEARTAAVVFNGEIYNYRKLREGLQARGHRFATSSDTEVIIHLYDEHGEKLVDHLEGMFTFAIWDFARQRLLLARDRLGIKPLFLAQLPGCIVFGSEIKCLMAAGVVPTDVNWNAIDQFFGYTYIPAPLSAYQAIRKVLPGTTLIIEADLSVREQRYWTVPDAPVEQLSLDEWTQKIDEGFRTAVETHLVSDVPIGAFLSGGIDSGIMVAQMAALMDRPVDTFTVGFKGAGSAFLDERVYARELATKFRLKHHEIDVESKVEDIIDEIVDAFDEPFADDSVVPSYYVSQVAAARVKVALTGLGGDELFGGYRRHLGIRLGDHYRRIPGVLRERVFDPVIRRLPEPKSASDVIDHLKRFSRSASGSAAQRYQDSLCTLPMNARAALYRPEVLEQIRLADTDSAITARFDGWQHGGSVDRALKTDLEVYLPDDILTLTDRLSMWHSLELRVPFLHHPFVELAMRVPEGMKIRGMQQKFLLKRVAAKYLPPSVINHKKQGFEAPMGRWLRGPLRPMLEATLDRTRIESEGIFRHAAISHLMNEHLSGAAKHSKILFSLLMFHLWHRRTNAAT